MSLIGKAAINSNITLLAQQLAKGSARQVLNKDQSRPVADNSVPFKPGNPNSPLASFIDRMNDAKQAIGKLNDATREINQSKKAFAAEVLKRIKEQIRIMMLLTGGDPKARARQIAALARELAAAAREYAATSGDSAPVGDAPASTGEQSDSAAATINTAEAATNTASATQQSDSNAASAAVPTPSAVPAETTPYQPNSTHQIYEQLANKFSEYDRTSAASNEDREFAMEVRKLAAQLKALAKQNEVHSRKGPDQSTERETADTNEALREVEHSLSIIESPNVDFTPSINIVVG